MTNDQVPMTNGRGTSDQPQVTSSTSARKFDLEERTARFGELVVDFALLLPRNPVTSPLISQLIRAGTSIGSNYCEADEAGSRKEFKYRVSLCCRESRETKYWLRMLARAISTRKEAARPLWKEADELNRIFAAIDRKTSVR
jgi:four helix bundle protein